MEISGVGNFALCSHKEIKKCDLYHGAADIFYGVNFELCQYDIVT